MKGINFGVIYGITPFGLSEAIDASTEEAAKYIESYFERHPGVKIYMQSVIGEARQSGFVRTIYGRKRYIPELAGKDARTRALGERLAMNSPIQGSAADIIKKTMVRLSGALIPYRCRLTIQVHDELVFECPAGEVSRVMEIIRAEMENTPDISVPLKVDIGSGENWASAHP
jgi:DNA polymerase-1